MTTTDLKLSRIATFAEAASLPMSPAAFVAEWKRSPVAEKVQLERSVGITSNHWTAEDEAAMVATFAESEWTREPTKRTQNRWRHTKTGAIQYSKDNPAKGRKAGAKTNTDAKSKPEAKQDALTKPMDDAELKKTFGGPAPDSLPPISEKDLEEIFGNSQVEPQDIADTIKADRAAVPERAAALASSVASKWSGRDTAQKVQEAGEYEKAVMPAVADNPNLNTDTFTAAVVDAANMEVSALVDKYGMAGAAPIVALAATGAIAGGASAAALIGPGLLSAMAVDTIPEIVTASAKLGAAALAMPAIALVHAVRAVARAVLPTHVEIHSEPDAAHDSLAAIEFMDKLTDRCFQMAKKHGAV
jgi:hypothetical protein